MKQRVRNAKKRARRDVIQRFRAVITNPGWATGDKGFEPLLTDPESIVTPLLLAPHAMLRPSMP